MDSISRETFEGSPQKTKLSILFDISTRTEQHVREIQNRLKAKAKIDKIYVGIGGFLGGLCSLLCREIFHWIG